MTEYVTGQIYGWNGGKCPVHPETKVQIWLRSCIGSEVFSAGIYVWEHSNTHSDSDIVCFQVVTPYVEPKVVWVNEFLNGAMECFRSEAEAKQYGKQYHTRIAVKYVEVKE